MVIKKVIEWLNGKNGKEINGLKMVIYIIRQIG